MWNFLKAKPLGFLLVLFMEKKKIWREHKLRYEKEKLTDSLSFEEAFRIIALTDKNLSWMPIRTP
jgi:hypothetical protein